MKYQIVDGKGIEIFGKDDFVPAHILECGQIFAYKKLSENKNLASDEYWGREGFKGEQNMCKDAKIDDAEMTYAAVWEVLSKNKRAVIFEKEDGCFIETVEPKYFENFFDLKTDYAKIKSALNQFDIMRAPVEFGKGIRILKQDLFETLISFIVSANNNIKRIQLILGRLREKFGSKMGDFYAFPTREQLLAATEKDFTELGAGYRAKYLFQVLRQIDENVLLDWQKLSTNELRAKLVTLAGVGPKVADCILLFGYGRKDVFPVDTWIEKMFWKFYGDSEFVKNELDSRKENLSNFDKLTKQSGSSLDEFFGREEKMQKELKNQKTAENGAFLQQNLISREKIRNFLTGEFGLLSGFAQQYLFFFMRLGE